MYVISMRTTTRCYSLLLALASITTAFTGSASATDEDFRMLGLAMHQETGRNIYLGAFYVGIDLPNPDNILESPAPKVMEYRIVARRTSIRSLMGSMLLQSEVATGHEPNAATVAFADDLLSSVKGSLYAGDSFEISQSEDKLITAHLNGLELTQNEDAGIFDYILMGWMGESGPSTAFRDHIMRSDSDRSLLAVHSAHAPSEDRIALVATWSTPIAPAAPSAAEPTATSSVDIAPGAQPEISAVAAAEHATTLRGGLAETEAFEIESTLSEILPVHSGQQELPIPESATIAMSEGQDESFVDATVVASNGVQSLHVTEYSHRLASFNTALIKLVYSEIQYPRRAVRREIQGALELDITMLEDGSLVDVAIAQSSGHTILDGAAVKAAEKAFKNASLGEVDPVAIAEYGDHGNVVVPVPVNFILQ